MNSSLADVRKLLALINSSAEDAIQQYESSGCGIPSLHVAANYQLPENSVSLRKSLRILEGACHQLCTTLVPPDITMYTRTYSFVDMACMRVVINGKVADVIPADADGLPVQEIARRTNLEPEKLVRIMRSLAATHCFREVKSGVFANNALSMTLRKEHPVSATVAIRSNLLYPCQSSLYDALIDRDYSHSFEANRSPFAYAIQESFPDVTFWDWLSKNPSYAELFHRSLLMLYTVTDGAAAVRDFRWESLPQGTTVCDFGSGIGTVGLELAKVHTNLCLTLQDTPSVLAQAKKLWNTKFAETAAKQQINFVTFDFFKEAPVEAQDVYYIRQVIHDWQDEDCVKILKNVRAAMKPSSRVLIHEYILRPNVIEGVGGDMETAPKPLLPNYGYGCTRTYLQDLMMLILLNSKERTLSEIQVIGKEAGLRFVKVWEFVDTCLIEFEMDL